MLVTRRLPKGPHAFPKLGHVLSLLAEVYLKEGNPPLEIEEEPGRGRHGAKGWEVRGRRNGGMPDYMGQSLDAATKKRRLTGSDAPQESAGYWQLEPGMPAYVGLCLVASGELKRNKQ
jgi:hypothetical protein